MNMKVIVVTHKITDLPFGGGGVYADLRGTE